MDEVGVSLRGPRGGGRPGWKMPTRARCYRLYGEDDDFRLWFDNLSRGSPTTAIERTRVIYRFLGLMGWTLDELTDRVKGVHDGFEKLLISFVGQQEAKGYSPGAIENYLKSVKSWANWHGVKFVRQIKISNRNSTPTLDDEKVPTIRQVEDIGSAMRPTYRYRPYVLRSYFSTRLLVAVSDGVLDNNYRVYWMGHKGQMSARYSSNKAMLPDDLIENMREAYNRSLRSLLEGTLNEDTLRRKQMLDTARILGYGLTRCRCIVDIKSPYNIL